MFVDILLMHGQLVFELLLHQVYNVDDANFQVGKSSHSGERLQRRTSPQQAMTTSGSAPLSLLAHSQMPLPSAQCLTAASIVSHCGA